MFSFRSATRSLPLLLASLLGGCRPGHAEPTHARYTAGLDWEAVGSETAERLAAYLRVDTINPPGNETRGARFLAEFLAEEGVPWKIFESAPGRGNLVARLPGSGDEGALCLLSHIDVVDAEAEHWPPDKPPLSGVIDEEGVIWGRGALDMKGMGMLETMVMALLVRQRVPLARDVVLLAVADEEVGNTGIRHLVEEHWNELGCSHVINEGGLGFSDMIFEGQTAWPVSVGEKGFLWARMVASGLPGHGSTPVPGQAPERLHRAVGRLMERKPRPRFHPALLEFLHEVGREHGGLSGAVLRHPALVRSVARGQFMGDPLTRAAITDTVNVTGYGGAKEPNVVPNELYANLDCRLLPGTSPQDMLEELQDRVDDPQVRFESVVSEPATVSPWDDPVYEALASAVNRVHPGEVVGPVISVGFTDSLYLRREGVRAYGLVPFEVTRELAVTMHGNGERVPSEQVRLGVEILFHAVVAAAAADREPWSPPPEPRSPPWLLPPEPETEPGPEPVQPDPGSAYDTGSPPG